MVTPKQVSETLNVPSSTIRRWAVRFKDVLSKQEGKKRIYTLEDVDTFRRIRDFSKQGRNLDAIEAELMIFKPKVEPAEEKGLMIHPEVLKVMQEINSQNIALQLQVDQLQAQVDWLMLPWWKKISKKVR
jgi:DNA-binding transcriptional MerR regulator